MQLFSDSLTCSRQQCRMQLLKATGCEEWEWTALFLNLVTSILLLLLQINEISSFLWIYLRETAFLCREDSYLQAVHKLWHCNSFNYCLISTRLKNSLDKTAQAKAND